MWYHICYVKKGVLYMVLDMIEQCKKKKQEIEEKFYQMVEYSDDIPTLEKLSDEMIAMEIMIIRMEHLKLDRMNQKTEYVI